MTDRLTREQIEALDALAQKATLGPHHTRTLSMRGEALLVIGPNDSPQGCVRSLQMPQGDAEFFASLSNAWPHLRDLALASLERREGWVMVPRERLQIWHRVVAQVAGHDEWGREIQGEMWAMLSATPTSAARERGRRKSS